MSDVQTTTATSIWYRRAKKLWRRAVWIIGDGPFALLAHCRDLSISLHETLENAQSDLKAIDEGQCGGRCYGDHEIVDMRRRDNNGVVAGRKRRRREGAWPFHQVQPSLGERTE